MKEDKNGHKVHGPGSVLLEIRPPSGKLYKLFICAVVISHILIKSRNLCHLCIAQFKIQNIQVFFDMIYIFASRDHHKSHLCMPAEDHLSALKDERKAAQNCLDEAEAENSGKMSKGEAAAVLASLSVIIEAGESDGLYALVHSLIEKVVILNGDVTIYWAFC